MTTDQEAENVAASVLHLMTQRGIDAREWERQAKQWEERWRAVTGERDEARAENAALKEQLGDLLWRARAVYRYVRTYETTRDGDEARMVVGEELWAAGKNNPDASNV